MRRGDWARVTSLCLVQFIDVLGVTVVVSALPAMLSDLHAPARDGSLVATGYAMFFGGLLMLGARLGDRHGHRRVILAGLGLFGCAAVLGAAANTVALLTAARCLQGAAAAISVPSALALLTTITPEGAARRRAIALWSAAGAAAGASGFVVGGVVTQLAGWRVVFWAYVPLAVALAAAIRAVVPADGAIGGPRALRDRFGALGVVAFVLATMLFVLATTLIPEHGHAGLGLAIAGLAAAAAVAFVIADRRARAPLLPRRLRRDPSVRAGALGAFLNTATTSSAITLATLYLQDVRGLSPLAAALLLLPFSLAVIGGAAVAAPALERWLAQRVIAIGLVAIATSDAALILGLTSSYAVPVCVILGGGGIGLSSVAATGLATRVSAAARGAASGIANTAAQLGTALGVAVVVLVADLTGGAPAPGAPVPAVALAVAAGLSLIGAVGFRARGPLRSYRAALERAGVEAHRVLPVGLPVVAVVAAGPGVEAHVRAVGAQPGGQRHVGRPERVGGADVDPDRGAPVRIGLRGGREQIVAAEILGVVECPGGGVRAAKPHRGRAGPDRAEAAGCGARQFERPEASHRDPADRHPPRVGMQARERDRDDLAQHVVGPAASRAVVPVGGLAPVGKHDVGRRRPLGGQRPEHRLVRLASWPSPPRPCRNTSSGRPAPSECGGTTATTGNVAPTARLWTAKRISRAPCVSTARIRSTTATATATSAAGPSSHHARLTRRPGARPRRARAVGPQGSSAAPAYAYPGPPRRCRPAGGRRP